MMKRLGPSELQIGRLSITLRTNVTPLVRAVIEKNRFESRDMKLPDRIPWYTMRGNVEAHGKRFTTAEWSAN